jgi:hypothetical protein
MRDLFRRLEGWLGRHCPAALDALAPGLMELALDLYEKDLGRAFPAGLRALYGWRNGVLPDRKGPIVGRYEHVRLNQGVRTMRDDVLPVFGRGDEHVGWHVPTGHVIAVIGDRTVIAPDFDVYMTAYVSSVEAGLWTVDDDGLDDGGAFAAALAARFPPSPFVPLEKPAPVVPVVPVEPPAIAYSPSTKFAVDDRVAHPKFGTGVVRAVAGTKVDIEFPSGRRTLVHARGVVR